MNKYCRLSGFCFLVLLLSGCSGQAPPGDYLVGAYYYVWYPKHFRAKKFLRRALQPPQPPELDYYSSSDPKVAEQHIAWASRYGIDFLVLDWWPSRPEQNRAISEGFLKASNIGEIKFCIFYEAQKLGMDRATGAIDFTEEKIERLLEEVEGLADQFFDHPSYLKIGGRPVLIFYLTRNFRGDYCGALERLRAALREKGHDLYLIGDEVFWEVEPAGGETGKTGTPQVERIELFDAITAYNMYESRNRDHRGYGAGSSYLQEVAAKYREYRDASTGKTAFVPGIIPGYNDRRVRLRRNHYPIPRRWEKGAPEGSFFARVFDRLGLEFADPELKMILITSWNEWNEDTAIEPLKKAPPTIHDQSESGTLLTEGYAYTGFGLTFLEIIRDKVVAVAGRVLDEGGKPVPGVEVESLTGGELVTRASTDSNGYYRFSRGRMGEGEYEVGVVGGEKRKVKVGKEGAVLGMDFVVNGI